MIRERNLWLTDHSHQTVEDFERVSAPGGNRREHSAYLDWLNTARVMRIVGLAPMSESFRMSFEQAKQEPKQRRRRGKTVILFDALLAAVLDEAKSTVAGQPTLSDSLEEQFEAHGIAVRRSVRGKASVTALMDEAVFWRDDLSGFIPRGLVDAAVKVADLNGLNTSKPSDDDEDTQ